MKIDLFDNGIDSLTKGVLALNKAESDCGDQRSRYLALKDAVLFTHHGIEILLKAALAQENELLVFSEVNNGVLEAAVQRRKRRLNSLFSADEDICAQLRTVSLEVAMERVTKYCGFHLPKALDEKIRLIQKYRNQITHSQISVTERAIENVFDGLGYKLDKFFLKVFGNQYKAVSGYTQLQETYEIYSKKRGTKFSVITQKTLRVLSKFFPKIGVEVEENGVALIDNLDGSLALVSHLSDAGLKFGADFSNLHCSGNVVEFTDVGSGICSCFAPDCRSEYQFKFAGLLVYLPKVSDDYSPVLFFFAERSMAPSGATTRVRADGEMTWCEGIRYEGDVELEWDVEAISEIEMNLEYVDDCTAPAYRYVNRLLGDGAFCFMNIQGMEHSGMKEWLHLFKNCSAENALGQIRKALQVASEKG